MKKIIEKVLLLTLPLPCYGQTLGWSWAKGCDNIGAVWTYDVATDELGNVYATGYFKDSIDFGGHKLTSTGDRDIFVVKYNNTGTVVWAAKAGGAGNDEGKGITVKESSAYITGHYSVAATFGSQSITSAGYDDIFIAKYDANGSLSWVKTAGSDLPDEGFKIKTDKKEHLYITGYFGSYGGPPHKYKTAYFDTVSVTSNGDGDVFIAKYDTSGNAIWVRGGGGAFDDYSEGVGIDTDGNVYIFGEFYSASIANFSQIQINFFSTGFLIGNFFLVKYDSAGNALWGRGIGGYGSNNSAGTSLERGGVVVAPSGSVYVTGCYNNGDLRFHNGQVLTEIGDNDIFIAKYSNLGDFQWGKKAGSLGIDGAFGIASDKNEHVYITGYHNGAKFDNDTPVFYGGLDTYVACYDSSGNVRWVVGGGGSNVEYGLSISSTSDGNHIVIGGFFGGTYTVFSNDTVDNHSTNNMFVAKLDVITGLPSELQLNKEVFIYPNPASDAFTIQAKANEPFIGVVIYDCTGRQVYSRPLLGSEQVVTMNCGKLSDGIYFVKALTKKNTITKQLIICH